MMFDRLRVAGLTGLLLLSATASQPMRAADCTGVATYSAGSIYTNGMQVVYNGKLYKAKWWTQNETPGTTGDWGVWQYVSDCGDVVVSCTAAPAVPSGLATSGVTSSSVNLSWSAVSAPANCSVTYNVYRGGTQVASGLTGTSTTVSGLTASTTYSFTVAAVDAAGSSAQSSAVSATTSNNGDNTGSCDGVPNYSSSAVYTGSMKVVYNNQLWMANWWTQGEAPSTGGSGVWKYVSECSSVACSAAPAVPSGLSSSNLTSTSVTLSWGAVSAPAGCTVSYKVYQNGTQVQTPGSNSVTISGLTANTTYSFTVASADSVGTSSQSAALSVKTPEVVVCSAAPSVPSGLAASNVTSSGVNLTWSASSAGAGCSITYNVYQNGTKILTVPTTSAAISGLAASTSYSFTVASVDSVGTSNQSSPVSITTTKINTTTLPKHILTGYWQNFNNGAKVLRISDVPTSYDIICVSFADATSTPGAVAFTLDGSLGFSEAQFIADIATVKARGQHVIISVGGQNGAISVADSASATNFASSINSLMNKYGFEGVDIDLENGVNSTYMSQALHAIKSGSIITMAPETIGMQSTGMEYFKLALNIKDILTVCNTQYYNSGCMLGYDQMRCWSQGNVDFLTALATIQLEGGLRADQVGLGLPASTSGAGSGYVAPSVVNQALGCLANGSNPGAFVPPHTYPAIRGAMTWSINWDASNGYNFANTVSPYLRSMP